MGGCKFCLLCRNAVSEASELGDADGDGDFRSSILKRAELDVARPGELQDACHLVQDNYGEDPEAFRVRQIVNGFTYSPYTMLTDPELVGIVEPCKQFMHDYMHCLWVNGVWAITFHLILRALRSKRVFDAYARLRAYVDTWNWPRRFKVTSKLSKLFESAREDSNTKAGKFRSAAGQAMSLAPIIVFFLAAFEHIIPTEFDVYVKLLKLTEMFASTHHGTITPDELLGAVEDFLAVYALAFGVEWMTPKFHWLLHFGDHLEQNGMLIACFVHERKHKMVKRYCEGIMNDVVFERSVIHDVATNIALRKGHHELTNKNKYI